MNTHYVPPTSTGRIFGSIVRWLTDRGISLAGSQTLTVAGRKTGTPQRIPVNPLRLGSNEYLISVRGESQWVRNARAAGRAELRRGRRVRPVELRELPVADRAPVLRAYLDRWGWEVKQYLPQGLAVDAPEDRLAQFADRLPVFGVR